MPQLTDPDKSNQLMMRKFTLKKINWKMIKNKNRSRNSKKKMIVMRIQSQMKNLYLKATRCNRKRRNRKYKLKKIYPKNKLIKLKYLHFSMIWIWKDQGSRTTIFSYSKKCMTSMNPNSPKLSLKITSSLLER